MVKRPIDACFFTLIGHCVIRAFLTLSLSDEDTTTVGRQGFRDLNQWENVSLTTSEFSILNSHQISLLVEVNEVSNKHL